MKSRQVRESGGGGGGGGAEKITKVLLENVFTSQVSNVINYNYVKTRFLVRGRFILIKQQGGERSVVEINLLKRQFGRKTQK